MREQPPLIALDHRSNFSCSDTLTDNTDTLSISPTSLNTSRVSEARPGPEGPVSPSSPTSMGESTATAAERVAGNCAREGAATSLDSFVTLRCAQHQKSGLPEKLMPPSTKSCMLFSPTNAPRDPNGGRSADFTRPRTCISSVVAVFMDALSQACMGHLDPGFHRL